MEIIERIVNHGDVHIGVTRSIEYNNGHDNTLITMDIVNGRAICASFKFNGMSSFGGGQMKLDELSRFKQLLNSFPEL